MSTADASSSLSLLSAAANDNPGLGTLGVFPREIRDQIYRYLVKGSYVAMCPSIWAKSKRKKLSRKEEQRRLAVKVLRLSKAINIEAGAIRYMEGIFQCHLDTCGEIVCLPQTQINRMAKIEVHVQAGLPPIFDLLDEHGKGVFQSYDDAWKKAHTKLSATDLVRKSIKILVYLVCYPITQAVSKEMIYDLTTLTKYRTVVVDFVPRGFMTTSSGSLTDDSKCDVKDLDVLIEAVKSEMIRALGPATVTLKRKSIADFPGTIIASCIEFQPQEHMAKALGS